MRACLIVLLAVTLAACSVRSRPIEMSSVVSLAPQVSDVSGAPPAAQSPQGGESRDTQSPQNPQGDQAISTASTQATLQDKNEQSRTPAQAPPDSALALHPQRDGKPSNAPARPQAPPGEESRGAAPTRLASLAVPTGIFTERKASRDMLGRDKVALKGYPPGTIIVRTGQRRLYFVLNDGKAIRYPVGVGKDGRRWTGKSFLNSKRLKPPWSPPKIMKEENPALPDVIPAGSPSNPMGDAALLIDGGEYAIHGTNRPKSIGTFASYGCIRMYNEDVMDLYARVEVGSPVVVER